MKILHVIGSVAPESGGPIEGILRAAGALADLGHVREIVCLDPPNSGPEYVDGVRVYRVGPNRRSSTQSPFLSWKRYRFSFRLLRWLRGNVSRYDVVVVNGLWNFSSIATWITCRKLRIEYVVYTHGMLDPWFNVTFPIKTLFKRLYWRMLETRVISDAAAVLFTTEEERLLATTSFSPFKGNGIVVGYGTAPPPSRGTCVGRINEYCPALDNRPFLLFLSRITAKKGCDILLRSFGAVCAEHPDLQLVMAGPDEHNLRDKLQVLAKSLAIDDRVHWPGMLKGAVKWSAFYESDAFVLASHSENFGIVVAEAMACATPVLTTNKVNIWQHLVERGCGFACEDNEQEFTAQLRTFLALSVEERRAVGDRGRAEFQRSFSARSAAIRFVAIAAQLTGR